MQKKRKRWATSSPFSKKYRLYMCNLCTAEKGRFFFHFCVHACAYGRMLFEVSRIKFHWIGLLCWKSVFYDFATSSSALNSFHFFFHGSEKNCLFSCSIVSIGIHLMSCQTVFFEFDAIKLIFNEKKFVHHHHHHQFKERHSDCCCCCCCCWSYVCAWE